MAGGRKEETQRERATGLSSPSYKNTNPITRAPLMASYDPNYLLKTPSPIQSIGG